jgi:hypothetical protein
MSAYAFTKIQTVAQAAISVQLHTPVITEIKENPSNMFRERKETYFLKCENNQSNISFYT